MSYLDRYNFIYWLYSAATLKGNNTLVNLDSEIATERGVEFLEIDPSKYTGSNIMSLRVISEEWMFDRSCKIF